MTLKADCSTGSHHHLLLQRRRVSSAVYLVASLYDFVHVPSLLPRSAVVSGRHVWAYVSEANRTWFMLNTSTCQCEL